MTITKTQIDQFEAIVSILFFSFCWNLWSVFLLLLWTRKNLVDFLRQIAGVLSFAIGWWAAQGTEGEDFYMGAHQQQEESYRNERAFHVAKWSWRTANHESDEPRQSALRPATIYESLKQNYTPQSLTHDDRRLYDHAKSFPINIISNNKYQWVYRRLYLVENSHVFNLICFTFHLPHDDTGATLPTVHNPIVSSINGNVKFMWICFTLALSQQCVVFHD